MTKNDAVQATDSHISILGHITKDELLREMNEIEAASGFANRFMWVSARRAQFLPDLGRSTSHRTLDSATEGCSGVRDKKTANHQRRESQGGLA